MNSINLPKRCQEALTEIEDGKAKRPGTDQVELTSDFTLYRCLEKSDYEDDGTLKASSFSRHSLSLYAEGPGLANFSIDSILDSMKDRYIDAVKISAGVILDSCDESMKALILKHDPYPDPVGNEHPNHARLVCTKGQIVCKKIKTSSVSVRKPGENKI